MIVGEPGRHGPGHENGDGADFVSRLTRGTEIYFFGFCRAHASFIVIVRWKTGWSGVAPLARQK